MNGKKIGIWLVVCLLLVFVLSACDGTERGEDSSGRRSVDASPPQSCYFSQDRDVYAVDDVELTFYCKDISIKRYFCQDFDPEMIYDNYSGKLEFEKGTQEYEAWSEKMLRAYENNQRLRPQYCDFYFESYGERYPIKRITEFDFYDERWDSFWYYSEKMTVPAELFANEYGRVRFYWTIRRIDGTDVGYSCYFYYNKTGDSVQIDTNDLNPKTGDDLWEEYENNEYAFWNYSSLYPILSDYSDKRIEPSYFASDDLTGDVTIDLFLGRTYSEHDEYLSTKLYFIGEDTGEEGKVLLKEIDYFSDDYLCDVVYNYDKVVTYVIYHRKEKLSIPKEYVTSGERVGIVLFGEKEGEEQPIPLNGVLFQFVFDEGHQNGYQEDPTASGVSGIVTEERLKEFLKRQ